MRSRTAAVALLSACVSTAGFAEDGLSTFGYTGLLNIPTASVMPEGYLDIQYNEDPYADADYDEHSNFLFSTGLFERFELGAMLSYANVDGRHIRNDLSANAKALLWDTRHWSLAAGWADFSGESEGTQNFEARYLVSTVRYAGVEATLGYGNGPDRLDGAFGGISWSPIAGVDLMADTDGDFAQAGVRLSFDVLDPVRLYALAKRSDADESPNAFGVGTRINLRFDRGERWFDISEGGDGLRNLRQGETASGFHVIQAENATYLQRQQDSASGACAHAKDGQINEYWQYRYGIPLIRSQLDCDTGRYVATAWLSQFAGAPQWEQRGERADGFPLNAELRFGLEERSFVGTDVGRFDYSAAAQGSLRLQGPFGLGAYATYNERFTETEDFEDGGVYDFYSVRDGLREYAAQFATHPLPGLVGVATLGRTYVNEVEYDFSHLDAAYHWGHGEQRTRVVLGGYEPSEIDAFANRQTRLIYHRVWLRDWGAFLEVGGGKYFYDDEGASAQLTRFFGDVSVSVFARVKDGNEQLAGIAVGIPFTPRRGLQWGHLSIVGQPRFTYAKSTSLNNDASVNVLRPTLLIEPSPIYNLTTDWLDADRLFPSYAAYSEE